MGKWMNKILSPEITPDSDVEQGGHLSVETLAQMIDGTIDPGEKEHCVTHLNSCPICYELFTESLKSMPEDGFGMEKPSRRMGKILYALAASVLLFLIAGGVFMKLNPPEPFFMASVTLDQDIRDVLLENDTLVWEDQTRIDRLEDALRARGLRINDIQEVVIDAPYFQSKGLLGEDELLSITIEEGIAHIKIIRKNLH